jgi:D-alanine-D-alanine ligase
MGCGAFAFSASVAGSISILATSNLDMRITVLTYADKEGSRDLDGVVAQVAAALRRKKHAVSVLAVHGDVKKLVSGLARRKPQLVFNILEEFADHPTGNLAVTHLLEVLGYRFTGTGACDTYLGQDKALAKKLLAFENILYPRFAVFGQDKDLETGGNLRMPLFVKPVAQDSSIGIGKKSLVRDAGQLMQRVVAIHKECNDGALAEEFIEGREFYVGILGNQEPLALPPIEADFSGLPDGAPQIYDSNAKWEKDSKEYQGITTGVADLPDEMKAKLQKVSLDAYRALRVRDYGRVDLRMTPTGDIYVLEVNASCYLEQNDEFAVAARAAGIEYDDLVQRIVDLAVARAN